MNVHVMLSALILASVISPCHGGAPKTCLQILKENHEAKSGVYEIDPDDNGTFKVYCDMVTDGGGWTVIQRRKDGSQDFYQNWADYKAGFGDLKGELYQGNDRIHRMTAAAIHKLRIDMEDFELNTAYAEYNIFRIGDETLKYKLTVTGYSGNAGDSFSSHAGQKFSTKDQDNDAYSSSCAVLYMGAWWYNACHSSNLNGRYLRGPHPSSHANGVNWYAWRGHRYSLKATEMKIRPHNY